MKIKKSMLVAGAVASFGLAGLGGLGAVSAANETGQSNMIDKLATRFKLNKDEVRAVFEEQHEARQAERHAEMSTRLQALVDEGKITSEQKTLIEAKHQEMQAAREAEHEELEAWAEQNGIDHKYLMGFGLHGGSNRLQNAVDSGEITAEQKTLIEQKTQELKDKREAAHEELEKWAEANGIDEKYVMLGGHGERKGGHGPRH